MSILKLESVSKGFGTSEVLHDVNVEIKAGEFVAIVGFSGAGKSTFISLLAGLQLPDSGRVLYQGKPVLGPSPERGIVFQNYSLLPWLTAFENVQLAVNQVFPQKTADERSRHVERYLTMVGLSHARDRKPAQLSGGMRQRVALARALATEPEVLLMDEPLSALDALTRATLQDELERISRTAGKTIILVTNDVDEAILLADRIIPLSAGPKATLGPETVVTIPTPRNRKTLNKDPMFRHIRVEVVEYLLGTKQAKEKEAAAKRSASSASSLKTVEVGS
jgi:nitrate/nitrite transport system ATP-binding protein